MTRTVKIDDWIRVKVTLSGQRHLDYECQKLAAVTRPLREPRLIKPSADGYTHFTLGAFMEVLGWAGPQLARYIEGGVIDLDGRNPFEAQS